MVPNKLPEFILLFELVEKLKDKEYYCTFAKTLLMSVRPDNPVPDDDQLVKEMFLYFIDDKQLKIYNRGSEVQLKDVGDLLPDQTSSATNDHKAKLHWDSDIFVKVIDLKKLYANKCIVLPNSLFVDKKPAIKT